VDRDTEIEFLREALRRRVEKTSVRQVAAEVKMSHGGVYNLVAGTAVPYGKTLAKLRAWYLEQSTSGGAGLTVPAARYLIDQMLAAVPPFMRLAASVALLENLVAVHARFGVPAPPWVDELRKSLEAEAGESG
jgi:AcrR family transcriptional regulator